MTKYLFLFLFLSSCSNEKEAEKHGIAEPCIRSHTSSYTTTVMIGKTFVPQIHTSTVCDERATVVWFHGEPHRLGDIWVGAPE